MNSEEFDAGNWVERLARALPGLSEVQEPFLQEYWQRNPHERVVVDGRDETPFPLGDLRMLYARRAKQESSASMRTTRRCGRRWTRFV